MDKMTETLLTVLALSQENYTGPKSHAFPSRLMPTLRKAIKMDLVTVDKYGYSLEEEGCILVEEQFGPRPFSPCSTAKG